MTFWEIRLNYIEDTMNINLSKNEIRMLKHLIGHVHQATFVEFLKMPTIDDKAFTHDEACKMYDKPLSFLYNKIRKIS